MAKAAGKSKAGTVEADDAPARKIHASNAKYEMLADDTVTSWDGRTLFRIRALVAIGLSVAAGDLGGYIEKQESLQVSGNAWVFGNAWVSGNAQVSGNAWVFGNAWVSGNAQVSGNAWVFGNAGVSGNAQVSGNARVFGDAWVSGDARVFGNAQVSGNAWVSGDARVQTVNLVATRSDGYTFLVAPTPQGPRIIAGCRYFSFDEAEAHWTDTRGGTKLGDESLSIVCHLKRMAELNGFMEPVAEKVEA